jgi:Asp-tRNA(Asn)/Glu-tRNA(Gln) amidotransferase A subunit family amidase
MAALIRSRKLSPAELTQAHLDRIARVNPGLNAFVRVENESAAVAAGASLPPGPLYGVPVSVKDSFDMEGLPTLCGSRFRLSHRAARDSAAAARLRAAGAVILGKTNCPEFLSSYETDNHITGRTNNPWNAEFTPGGSSGGEAAAIAARCSAGGIGSDGGGSIRIPAHFCGIAGLKPTPGRVSAAGHFPEIAHPGGLLGVAGPMARTVEDVKILFEALAGYDIDDPFSSPVPLRPPSLEGLRIGLMERFYQVPVDPEIRETVLRAARALEQLRFPVEPFEPKGLERAPNLWWFFFGQLPARLTRRLIEGREADAHWTGTEFMEGALKEPEPTAEQVLTNLAVRDKMRAAFLRQLERYPVLLLPPCGVAAFRHRERRWSVGEKSIGLFEAMMPATAFNLLGLPALAVPYGFTRTGMPIGIQLAGAPYSEELLLAVGSLLESARGPFPPPPGSE